MVKPRLKDTMRATDLDLSSMLVHYAKIWDGVFGRQK